MMSPPSVGNPRRAITRPLSSRTEATVVAWWTSNATYLVVRFMRAAPCCGPRVLVDSMVTATGALSTCVRRRYWKLVSYSAKQYREDLATALYMAVGLSFIAAIPLAFLGLANLVDLVRQRPLEVPWVTYLAVLLVVP